MTTNTLSLLERCKDFVGNATLANHFNKTLLKDLEAAIAAERSKEQAKPQQEPELVQIASDIMGACMNGYLDDKWEDVADCLVTNNFDGLAKLAPLKPLSDEDIDGITTAQWGKTGGYFYAAHRTYTRAIEAKLGAQHG